MTGIKLSPSWFGVKIVSAGFSALEVFINTTPCPVVTVALQYGTPISFRKTILENTRSVSSIVNW